jgi:hypothetical protein
MKSIGTLMGACLLAGLSGCTAQQWYASGQSWQRNQCFRLVDTAQRNQCLSRTWVSYDQYERELHADAVRRARSGSR